MKNTCAALTILVLSLAVSGCDHDTEEPVAPAPLWDVNAITRTDVNGVPIGTGDADDWRTDVVFDQTASSLFSTPLTTALLPRNDTTNFIACYPNPMREIAMLTVRSVRPCDRVELVIADAQGARLWNDSRTFSGTGLSVALDIGSIIGSANAGNFRLLYRCSLGDSITYLQGYGDIRIEP